MKKVYKKLTPDQISRNIIFSSCLSIYRTEQPNDRIHEVKKDALDGDLVISCLLDDAFFNHSQFKYNIIRTR